MIALIVLCVTTATMVMSSMIVSPHESVVAQQASALLALFDATTWPTRNWTRAALTSANASEYCAEFDGVECDNSTQPATQVVAVRLRALGVLGALPDALLSGLGAPFRALDVAGNPNLIVNFTAIAVQCGAQGAACAQVQLVDLSGGVDVEFDSDAVDIHAVLPSLASFALGPAFSVHAANTTAFLNQLFRLPALQELSLRDLPGLVGPNEIDTTYLCSATQLRSLRLSRLRLTGFVPPLACWTQVVTMRVLDLSGNLLGRDSSGAVQRTSSALLCQGTALEVVDLSGNLLAMELCTNFTGSQLREYSVANNALTGELPADGINAPRLVAFDLSWNNLSCALPPSFLARLPPTLARLALAGNSFTGRLRPADLLSAAALGQPLAVLDLTHNSLRSEATLYDLIDAGVLHVRNFSSTLAGAPGVVCFQLLLANGGLLNVDADLYDYTQCECADGFVGNAPHCMRCPALASECRNRNISFGRGVFPVLVVNPNVVTQPNSTCLVPAIGVQSCGDRAHACRGGAVNFVHGDFFDVTRCVPQDAFCDPGYTGRLCSNCKCDAVDTNSTCYYGGERDTHCHECSSGGGIATLVSLLVLTVIAYVVFAASLYVWRVPSFGELLYLMLALFSMYYVGVTALMSAMWLSLLVVCMAIGRYGPSDELLRVGAFWVFATTALAPRMTSDIMHTINANGVIPLIECVFPGLAVPLARLGLQAVLPLVLIGLIVLAVPIGRCFLRVPGGDDALESLVQASGRVNEDAPPVDLQSSDVRLYQRARMLAVGHATLTRGARETALLIAVGLASLLHFDMCYTALSMFKCDTEPVSGAEYVQQWPSMQCGSTEHTQVILLGIGIGVLWCLVVPIAAHVLVRIYPRHPALTLLWSSHAAGSQHLHVWPFFLVRNIAFAAAITVTRGPVRIATVNALALIAIAVHHNIATSALVERAVELTALFLIAFSTSVSEAPVDADLDNAPLTVGIVNGVFACALLLLALTRTTIERRLAARRRLRAERLQNNLGRS
jgi:hypothetical protein